MYFVLISSLFLSYTPIDGDSLHLYYQQLQHEWQTKNVQALDITIRGSLISSLKRKMPKKPANQLAAHIARVMMWWMDLRTQMVKGDQLEVVYSVPDDAAQQYHVYMVRYNSLYHKQQFEAYYYHPASERWGRYYDSDGVRVSAQLKHSPLHEYEQITTLMSYTGRRHLGVDYKAPKGTPIYAPHDVKVLRKNWRTKGNGYCLDLLYVNTKQRVFMLHLDNVAQHIKAKQQYPAGTVLAYVGNTGKSTSPHLHYEMRNEKGAIVNPFEANESYHPRLPDKYLDEFQVWISWYKKNLVRLSAL